jgi:hypothetical protein
MDVASCPELKYVVRPSMPDNPYQIVGASFALLTAMTTLVTAVVVLVAAVAFKGKV